MEAAVSSSLQAGDLILTSLDDLHEAALSEIRLLVARPEAGRILLISAARTPEDDGEVCPTTLEITSGNDESLIETGRRWNAIERHVALRAAARSVGGQIVRTWARIWSTGQLHIIARVARPGMYDSLRTITVRRPVGLFRPVVSAKVGYMRPLPKLFQKTGSVRVHGEIDSRNSGRKQDDVSLA